jgi:hypothetical protein
VKPEEVLAKLEQHEAECNLRYQRIEEKLGEQSESLKLLDTKIWGIAALIIATAVAERFM